MPIYTFENPFNGKRIEQFYRMKDAPRIGEIVIIDGDTFVRQIDLPIAAPIKTRHFVCKQMPRNYKHHLDAGGKVDSIGRPVFDSMKQVEATGSRSRGEEAQGGYTYD